MKNFIFIKVVLRVELHNISNDGYSRMNKA